MRLRQKQNFFATKWPVRIWMTGIPLALTVIAAIKFSLYDPAPAPGFWEAAQLFFTVLLVFVIGWVLAFVTCGEVLGPFLIHPGKMPDPTKREPNLLAFALWILLYSSVIAFLLWAPSILDSLMDHTFFQIMFIAISVGAMYLVARSRRKNKRITYRRANNLCVACAYDLRANTTGVCPECGTNILP